MTSSTLEPENNQEIRPSNSNRHPNRSARGARQATVKPKNKEKAKLIFFTSCMLIVLILVPFTTETFVTIQDFLKDKPSGYEWPNIQDFWLTIAVTPIFFIIERVFQYFLYPWYYKYCKE